jgi:hypothetical protein
MVVVGIYIYYLRKEPVMSSKLMKCIQTVSIVFLMLLLSGCGAKVTLDGEFTLVENAGFPGISEIGSDLGDVNLLPIESGPVLLGEVCGLSEIEALLDNNNLSAVFQEEIAALPFYVRLLLRSTKLESLILKNITLRAHEGDFNFLNQLRYEVRSQTTGRSILVGDAQGEFGQEVVLAFEDDTDLLDMSNELEGTDCIESYLDLEGAIPSQNVTFQAVMKYEIELRIGWVL